MQQTSKRTPPTTAQFLRYHADRLMAAGAIAQLGVLALLTLVPVVITGVVLVATKIVPEGTKEPFDLLEGLWLGLMYALDAGNLGGAQGWSYRMVMAGVTSEKTVGRTNHPRSKPSGRPSPPISRLAPSAWPRRM